MDDSHGRGWRVLGWISVALSVVLVCGSLAGYGFYRDLTGNITRERVTDRLGDKRPAKLNKSMNILLIGSDSRAGANARFGVEAGQRADTTILLHISPGGDRVLGMSFPRDSMVQIPSCKKHRGGIVPGRTDMINSAFALGGPACTWQTIESLTGIRIDHFVQIDFSGFTRIVNALGGVQICVPRPINDPKANLRLRKGVQTVRGEQALGYVRTRTGGLGDGSDLSRIRRQQSFMASVVQKATSGELATDPNRMYEFLSAATKSITTDEELTLATMKKLADSLKGMSAGKVRFVTVPVQAYPPDINRVQFDQARAKPLFDAIRLDNRVPKAAPKAGNPAAALPEPAEVKVAVYNGTGIGGLGQRTADRLTEAGYQVVKVGTKSGAPATKTRILYGAGADRQAAALARSLPGVRPAASTAARAGYVYLIIGPDGAEVQPTAPTEVPKIDNEVRGDQNPCKAA